MTMTYETVTPSPVPNTIVQKMINNGVHLAYTITPIDGYVMHDKNYDTEVLDENDEPTGEVLLGYHPSRGSVAVNYDFAETTVIDGYTAYGSREFFARPESEVPPDHEVM